MLGINILLILKLRNHEKDNFFSLGYHSCTASNEIF